MFLYQNVLLLIPIAAILLIVFTFFNIYTFAKDFQTSAFLTVMFFDLLLSMPFKAVRAVYSEREHLYKELENDTRLTDEQKRSFRKILNKRYLIFIAFFKAGEFSYTGLLISLTDWYKNKPFKFKVRISVEKQKKKDYEKKYLNNMKKDLTCLEI
ncbi:hypothetical protein AB6L51_03200 [Bacillus altitudinis]|uniref:hypothetical protein n=1 Tax=Bacillus altitudinis TaxID=293387 RepID=UPI0038B4DCE5